MKKTYILILGLPFGIVPQHSGVLGVDDDLLGRKMLPAGMAVPQEV